MNPYPENDRHLSNSGGERLCAGSDHVEHRGIFLSSEQSRETGLGLTLHCEAGDSSSLDDDGVS